MKTIIKTFLILIFALILCGTINAQKVEIEQETANRCAKCFAESEAKDLLISAQAAQITAQKELLITKDLIISQQKELLAQSEKLVEIYKSKSQRKISFLFGLIKVRY